MVLGLLARSTIGIRNERSVRKRHGRGRRAGDWTVGQARYILASPAYRRSVSSPAPAAQGTDTHSIKGSFGRIYCVLGSFLRPIFRMPRPRAAPRCPGSARPAAAGSSASAGWRPAPPARRRCRAVSAMRRRSTSSSISATMSRPRTSRSTWCTRPSPRRTATRPGNRRGGRASLPYSIMPVTTPAPTVRPPSRIAKRRPSSIAIGAISSTSIAILSPGITISVPSGSFTDPVTSVVRK